MTKIGIQGGAFRLSLLAGAEKENAVIKWALKGKHPEKCESEESAPLNSNSQMMSGKDGLQKKVSMKRGAAIGRGGGAWADVGALSLTGHPFSARK